MNYFYKLFFLCFFLINHTHAEVPFTWLLHMYTIINPAYHHLLPLHGILCPVEHMYRDDNKLVKELFYLQEDGVSFRPTILKSKPASYWTPKDIGMIIATITNYREKKLDDYLLHITLEQIMQPQKEKMSAQEQYITTRINAQKEILKDITQQIRELLTLIGQIERKPCTTLEQLNQKITEIEQLQSRQYFLITAREPIEQDIKKLKYDHKFIKRALHNGITELIIYLCDSIKESAPENKENIDDVHATEHILLAFLWKIANPRTGEVPKQDFVDYFNELGTRVNADNLDAWIIAEPYCLSDYEQWLQHTLKDTADYQLDIPLYISELNKYDSPEQQEQNVLAHLGQAVWKSPLPPIITQAGAIFTDKNGNQTEQSSACVETSFRIFLNMILYNTEKKYLILNVFVQHHKKIKIFRSNPTNR